MFNTRHLLLLPCVLLLACSKNDSDDVQPDAVPQAVRTSFATRFPTVTDLDWEKQGANYEADFKVNAVDHDALLDPAGTVLMYKYDIATTDLPAAVQAALAQNHAGLRLDDVETRFQGSSTETSFYQVELDVADPQPDRKLVYSADGQEVSQPAYWD